MKTRILYRLEWTPKNWTQGKAAITCSTISHARAAERRRQAAGHRTRIFRVTEELIP